MKARYFSNPLVLILIAFSFSVVCRFFYIWTFYDSPEFKFLDEFMLNNPDGYYWAEGARDILNSIKVANDLSPIDSGPSIITAFLAKILPFSFETVIFFMPAFFGSLIVIPLILIGKSFGKISIGFAAALIASVAWSYYNRTMVGYYDTDALNIVFPTFMVWSLILYFKTFEQKYLIFTALEIIAYRWWYPASYSLEVSFFMIICIYLAILIFQKKYKDDVFLNTAKMASMMLFAMLQVDESYRLIAVFALYFIFLNSKFDKYILYIFGLAILAFIATGGFEPIIFYVNTYVLKNVTSVQADYHLQFYGVMQTIKEASSISFIDFANRVSGSWVLFLASIFGSFLFLYHHRSLIFALPLVAIGFAAYGIPGLIPSAGLRFTIYAVPVMALGAAFTIYFIANELSTFGKKKQSTIIYNALFLLLCVGFLTPNINHILTYKVPSVFTTNEVQILSNLSTKVSRDDYVIAWWDYGYPIRYYSDTKTLVDGGKHNGDNNYPVAFCMISNQEKSAKMARLAVEYTEKLENPRLDVVAPILADYKFNNPNIFWDSMELTDFKLPSKTREIYFYLPYRMSEILPTISLFGNIDLTNGKKLNDVYYETARYQNNGDLLQLENGMIIDTKQGKIISNEGEINIKELIWSEENKTKQTTKFDNHLDGLNVIVTQDYDEVLILDDFMLQSTFVKLFFLENVDNRYFELVSKNPYAKIFKLKI